ncbi:MAG: hypothetical protein QG635_259, partial [Bacteroidota bacterium]|nr:hypothetical protein [Bacteroidota bacterium]
LPMTIITIYYIFIKGSLSYTDMVVLYFIGAFVSSALSLLITGKRLQFGLKGDFRIWKMIKFSSPYMLYSSLHAMPKLLDIYILQSFFSTGIVGVYAAAKTLFRVFDEAGNAVFSLVYPAAVRSAGSGSKYELHALMTKAVSFMLIIFGISALFLELGFSKYLITLLLPYKYTEAVGFFNLLIIAALGIPFVTISLVITADGKPEKVLQFIIVGVISSFAAFYAIGIFQLKSLIPVGIIVYYFVCSVLFFIYLNRRYGFKFKHLFRAVPDTMSFIRARFINK